MGLFTIPWATPGRPQAVHDFTQFFEALPLASHSNIDSACFQDRFVPSPKGLFFKWVPRDSNPGPIDYESIALTAELGTDGR
ncbi:MAG: hypothetical protein UZ16_OP3001002049 [Candidatus Hinthialibacteria bacterium OLB16]|nr:MAG: hypothetical protein UZ16_OP3001002049 [Candidatus Hinthialibacteria bacterium OLB16]